MENILDIQKLPNTKMTKCELLYLSEVGGVSPSLDRPRTGKSISVAFALRACVRASEAA